MGCRTVAERSCPARPQEANVSVEATTHTVDATAHGHAHEEHLSHQFEDRGQQDESYVVGMWSFLVTEVLFFGALFLAYSLFRIKYPAVYITAHEYLNPFIGGFNTFVLLTSSLSMALAVWAAQTNKRFLAAGLIVFTILCAFTFLGVKFAMEWYPKYQEHLVPGATFHFTPEVKEGVAPEPISQDMQHKLMLFFGLYFAMTGLHAIHVVVGIGIMAVLVIMLLLNRPQTRYYMPIELTGLYWHFVDIVWIFLYPLFYLIGKK